MAELVSVSGVLRQRLSQFLLDEQIALQLAATGRGKIHVEDGSPRHQCTEDTIFADGWINCEDARTMARRLGIPVGQMGQLMDFLNVKIRNCGLGCFK